MHRPHGRLICPENMKQLPFTVSEQCPGQDFEGEHHNFKAEGQNNWIGHRFHVRLISLENMKQLSCIVCEYWPRQDLSGQTAGGNENTPLVKIWPRGKKSK